MSSDPSNLEQFLSEARVCAVAMMDTAKYVQDELHNVSIEEPTLSKLLALLPEIAGTGRTVYETVALLHALQLPAGKNIDQRGLIQQVIERTSSILLSLNEIVGKLSEASQQDPSRSPAFILLAESAVNIFTPFHRASAAANRLVADLS